MSNQIKCRVLTPQATAVVRATVPAEALPDWLAGGYRRVARALARQGVTQVGPRFARYTQRDIRVEVEAGFPVATPVVDDADIRASGLPGSIVAVATHLGGYEHLDDAYGELEALLDERGLVVAGPCWEVYHTDRTVEPDPQRWRTDIVVPWRLVDRVPATPVEAEEQP